MLYISYDVIKIIDNDGYLKGINYVKIMIRSRIINDILGFRKELLELWLILDRCY